MTDNEIIKALERCPQHKECCYCNSLEECGSKRILTTSALDLITRQQAEIERLKGHLEQLKHRYDICKQNAQTTKSKAVKKFAERLKEKAITYYAIRGLWVSVKDIDNLVKETVGEK